MEWGPTSAIAQGADNSGSEAGKRHTNSEKDFITQVGQESQPNKPVSKDVSPSVKHESRRMGVPKPRCPKPWSSRFTTSTSNPRHLERGYRQPI